ncbi:hypothetical protein [Haloechinothrix salitolerans]|uniref:hypothetical protein n=1 Tax=Haloechinothrix salitolerans TaxID=926830 RepID=UPI0031E99E8E
MPALSRVWVARWEHSMISAYEATWLPLTGQSDGEDPTIVATAHAERLCCEQGVRGVLVTHHLRDAATSSLERFAANHGHITRKSPGRARYSRGPVLVDVPDAKLLELAHKRANGRSLCAIEGGQLGLRGWATATDAVDLVTGERPEPLAVPIREALDALKWAGNNGWYDRPGKRDARRILQELIHLKPSLDADFVIGYMIARGAFGDSAEGLRKLMPIGSATSR